MNPSRPPNRELIAADLQALAELGGQVIAAMMPLLTDALADLIRTSPLPLGPLRGKVADLSVRAVSSHLQGSATPALSASLLRLLDLSDPDLAALLNGVGWELGAWAGYHEPLTPEQAATLAGSVSALLGAGDPDNGQKAEAPGQDDGSGPEP